MNNITNKVHAHIPDVDIAEIQNKFWKEWKMFNNEKYVYEKRNMWNVNDERMGNSTEWHVMYSKCQTEVMGFIYPWVTSPGVGMGDCERGKGVTKRIKSGQRAKLTGANIDKLSIISTTNKLNKARIKGELLEGL